MFCDLPPPAPIHYEEKVSQYRDDFGLLTQSKDGGDSANRLGIYYFGLYLIYKDTEYLPEIKESFNKELEKVTVGPGVFVRHPDKAEWYSNPRNFSRDQTIPLIVSMGALDRKDQVKENFKRLIKNFGFFPNILKNWTNQRKRVSDFAGPGHISTYLRALDYKAAYPILLISDVGLFVGASIRVVYSYADPSDTGDDLNTTLMLLQSEQVMPTPLSKLAILIYSNLKKISDAPEGGHTTDNPVMASWNFYFRPEANQARVNQVYECIIPKYFKKFK